MNNSQRLLINSCIDILATRCLLSEFVLINVDSKKINELSIEVWL